MATPVLEGRGIGKVFGRGELAVRALQPTDIAVRTGEVLVVMGPSGSGKTTLLTILGLVLEPSEGEVFLDGQSVAGARADRLAELRRDRVGFVFQQFNLLSGLSAVENVAIPLLLRGASQKDRVARARAALELVGMGGKAEAKARALSVGQQQRVAIARALVAGAEVLLCDEPTASLDRAAGQVVLDLIRDLAHSQNRAVVVVSHDERVLRIADRVIQVEDGRARELDRRPMGERRTA